MNKKKAIIIILFNLFVYFSILAELKFNPIALNEKNEFLFNSVEILAGIQFSKTLFYGYSKESDYTFEAVSFYPEDIYYSNSKNFLYIHNRMGLYYYDFNKKVVKTVEEFPNFTKKDEYIIYQPPVVSFSPDYKYAIYKINSSNIKADIYLYDLEKNEVNNIISNVDINPGEKVGSWSNNSKYFLYQKDQKSYYFSINDYKKDKLLAEEWRLIGNVKLNNTYWTDDDYLIWVENNMIYKADSRQFYSRSIYKSYLRLGNIIGKIPFSFDPSFDLFIFNNTCKKFIIVKKYISIFYYSLNQETTQDSYMQLSDTMHFKDCKLFDNGEAVILIDKLDNGKVTKKIVLIKNQNNKFIFQDFNNNIIDNNGIRNINASKNEKQFIVNTSKGSYCFDLDKLELVWKFEDEGIIQSINIDNDKWILGGENATYITDTKLNTFTPIFASSFNEAGLLNDNIGVIFNNKKYILDKDKKTLSESNKTLDYKLYRNTKNFYNRLISREINKGFYKEGVYIKELHSGKLFMITGEPNLRYQLYQPEVELGVDYYDDPSSAKYEIALVFDCIKTDEGIFPILDSLSQIKAQSTFFINGSFMEINPLITKEIVHFDIEIGNLFQYYVMLTNNDFLIDKNFIRQGLSVNEENFFRLTGKNFSPIWHSPKYAFNDSIIQYGKESGYQFVTFNLDSLDWVGEDETALDADPYLNNDQLIERIVQKIKPGQIIVFSTGKNNSIRDNWLFNEIDLLLSELIRSGYSFTTVTDLLKKYRRN